MLREIVTVPDEILKKISDPIEKVGINEKGNQVFKLDSLTELNNIFHNAHDAMGDVDATIEIAKILQTSSNKVWNAGLKNNNKIEFIHLRLF